MSSRRTFVKTVGLGSLMAYSGNLPLIAKKKEEVCLTILHTNDTHSHLDPFPDNDKKFPGLGGVAARKVMIDKIRNEGNPVLLLDAGDVFQGTPYFNFFLGEPELKAMSMMGYDAATIGNHDFDGGIENMYRQLFNAQFSFINSNYDFSNTILKNSIKSYEIFVKNGIRVGVLGLGVELDGLVPKDLYKGVIYKEPLSIANDIATYLKIDKKCDLVILLSHLGYKYNTNKVSDIYIAENSYNIDIIIGGHTHTFMENADVRKNKMGEDVVIHQVGWAGVQLGRLNVKFFGKLRKISSTSHTVIVDKNQS
ncbi:MAG: metallophosphatase [Chitinophagales bacterium]|nr:metallophosphatase [Chitinophagales bacterium]MCZ2393235.1 metallophosphatase [Chitinophagales bacterium]